MKILILVKHLLKLMLNSEGTNGAQALERGRKVGEYRTPSFKKNQRSNKCWHMNK